MIDNRSTDPNGTSELDGLEDIRGFIGHTAWKAAPTVRIDVDQGGDLLTATFYEGPPDVEIDPSSALSVGFHRYRDEYLLTSLCLYGVARWAQGPAMAESTADVAAAHELLGVSTSCAADWLLCGGGRTLDLPVGEAVEVLLPAWHRFVATHAPPRTVQPIAEALLRGAR